ncbi:hypothetical protein SAMN05216368_11250 [Cryobacterium flavum]|uniref:Type IV secretion protein Rhs n=1 Tax=Cryobacterium flavum TaxID=1424659 RepID=A0A4R8UU75_9MICO|nr:MULTISPECIES: hypothetical protein [Cryobacterium]TFB72013.1 hypothetical protein E3O21_19440 [Cryobacterium flavum]SDO20039.1 hypothetical protein SAMN05216368_11250 [Cryobacterium flavum]
MTHGKDSHPRIKGPGGLTAWLNGRLFPILGPPPVGPSGSDLLPAAPALVRGCPVCAQPMDQHDIDRTGERTQLHCPVALH